MGKIVTARDAILRTITAIGILAFASILCMLADGATGPSTLPASQPSSQPAKEFTLDLGNNVTMKLAVIPAGKFMMGSPESEKGRRRNEGPSHEVTITRPFCMGVYAVTQEQWTAVMGTTPWKDPDGKDKDNARSGAGNAANWISWDDAAEFCKKLSIKTGEKVKLPTEAQWEYACRAGSTTRFSYGDDDDCSKLGDYAWYFNNTYSVNETYPHRVGQKKPNAWGLYDMHGNVWQCCSDYYADSYAIPNRTDPQGPVSGVTRVLRGGGWYNQPQHCRSAGRDWIKPDFRFGHYGFRIVVVTTR